MYTDKAYSVLEVKSFDTEQRIIEGVASAPTTDRMGDIVDLKGITFASSIPLLLHHDKTQPIGTVRLSKTKDALAFTAKIARVDEAGTLKDRLDEAWQSIKAGLLRGASIGFRVIDDSIELIKETGGLHFLKTEVLELSVVTVPAHQSAGISVIRSLDVTAPATGTAFPSTHTAGVSATRTRVTARTRPSMKKTYTEQIQDFEATRASLAAEKSALMDAANEKHETLDDEQTQKYDELTTDIKKIDGHLIRLREMEKENLEKATPLTSSTTMPVTPETIKANSKPVQVQVNSRMGDGLEFAAAVLCKAYAFTEIANGKFVSALDVAKRRYPDNLGIQRYIEMETKTAVAGGTTSDSNWATSLLEPNQVLVNDFLEYLRPRTIIGQIPGLRRVPFNVTIQSQTTAASASWVGQGKGKPLTKFNTATTTLAFTKIAAIAVITDELARFSRPGAEGLVRDELARAVIERMDTDFIDPAKAVSSGVNPASITNGLTALTTAGTSAANALTDIQNLVVPFITAKYDVGGLVLLMPSSLAFALSLMINATNGGRFFPNITISGGTIGGLPVVTSQYLANTSSYGNMVIALSAPDIALADDGRVDLAVSREASLQMDDAPTQDSTAGTGSSVVSMFQTNSVAIRAEREINWKKLRSDAVTFMDDVNWGSIGSPV
jgi:HK97 family phage major capsid protein/HK97 family phage prohead protease